MSIDDAEIEQRDEASRASALSVGALREAIARVALHAIPQDPESLGLGDGKDVVIRIGDSIYPLTGVAVGVRGGLFVLELVGGDVPPCGYCGRVGAHPGREVCPAEEYASLPTARAGARR